MTITTVLDTTVAETGPTQTMEDTFVGRGVPLRFTVAGALGTGDSIVIEGKAEAADTFHTHATIITTPTPVDVLVSRIWRARRSVDGTTGDTVIKVHDPFNETIDTHE